MMIDRNTGHLTFSLDKVVTQTTTLADLKGFAFGEMQEERNLLNGWIHFVVKNVEMSGKYLNITFFFHQEALNSVTFIINNSPFDLESGWGTWNEKEEREKVIFFTQWLEEQVGPARNFTWGHIWAAYDPLSGGSSIGIRYK
ncbi:hypothetical protein [Sabulibacter ruber]|uniref:hypothetical protein n=1 Tax=Sabulibacter ruber TaxID=2811901 RepID=UPI001A966A98|nr:hypothetical protein [Sabulibacter ruber]